MEKSGKTRGDRSPRVFLLRMGSCVLPNGRRHIIPASLHIGDQLELGAAAVQILPCPVDGKVMIALQIVGEEADPALQRHEFGPPWQILQFRGREDPSAAL